MKSVVNLFMIVVVVLLGSCAYSNPVTINNIYQIGEASDIYSLDVELFSESSPRSLSINSGDKYWASFRAENTYTVDFTGKFKIRVHVPDPVPPLPNDGDQGNPSIYKHASIVHQRSYGVWNALVQTYWNRRAYDAGEEAMDRWWYILINKTVQWKSVWSGYEGCWRYIVGNADYVWDCPVSSPGNYYTNSALTRGLETPEFEIQSGQYIRIVPGERRDVWYDNAGGMTFEIVRPGEEKDGGANKKDPTTDQGDDPVNITNGNMYSTTQDLFIPGKGIPIEFSRTYNSKSLYNGSLGYGWTHSYNIILTENPDGSITERDEDGTLIDFTYENAWETGILDKVDITAGDVKLERGGIYTKLLLHCNGTDGSTTFTDSSDSEHIITANGNAQIDTAQKEFGTGSVVFDGTGDYLSIPDSSDWDFGNEDFTIDFWVRFNIVTNGERYNFCSQRQNASNWFRFIRETDNRLHFQTYADAYNSHYYTTNIWTPNTNTWYHIALVRNSTSCYIFIDGISQEVTQDVVFGTIPNYTGNFTIGAWEDILYYGVNGWLDEIRISKGIARWTSNFTPPASEYELKYPSFGTLNLKYDSGSDQSWQSYFFIGDESNGTNIKVRFRSSDTEEGLETATWSQYYDAVTDVITDVSDGQWVEIELTLESDPTQTYTPLLKRFIINYSGGSKTWEYGYKAWDHSVIIKNPDGTFTLTRKHGIKYNFNSSGRLVSIIDRNNNQITLTYTDGLLTAVTDASGRVVNLSYTSGRITQIIDPANRLIIYNYDGNNNLIQARDPSNNTTAYAYDANHNLVTITHANGNHVYFAYDSEDRCIETKRDEDNQKFTFSYDPANFTTIMTDANGNQKVFIYNKEKGVVTSITDALGNVTFSIWDEDINRTSINQP